MIKRIFLNWHRYILWALLSAIFWAWIVMLVSDAPMKKKVVIYADLPEIESGPLEVALEKDKPKNIRFVEAALFDNVIFDSTKILYGDLYLIPESDVEEYLASFTAFDPAEFPGQTFYESEGKTYGILVYDAETGPRFGEACIRYPEERCYLFFNSDSLHIGEWNGSADDAAITVARNFLQLEQGVQP